MTEEIILTGGRTTQEVVLIGDRVFRSIGPNTPFVHHILTFLENAGVHCVPKYMGMETDGNREILSYITGSVPRNLGQFSIEQCCQAVQLMKALHKCLQDFPGCPDGETVCHNDLSPCNFVFNGDKPIAVIDWDAASFGCPLNDLAYAIWMWVDIGNEENDSHWMKSHITAMLDTYEVPMIERGSFYGRIIGQMERVAESVFPTQKQTYDTRVWALGCKEWFQRFWRDFM